MKVAFFGGSFNPPHVGHVLAAAYARSVGFDAVIAVVVSRHAFNKHLEDFEHRVHMAELAFAPIGGVSVSRIEASLPAPNYTLNTLRALARENPHWQMRLLIGSDVLSDAQSWHAFDEIEKLAPPFALCRSGHTQTAAEGVVLPDVSSTEVRKRLAEPALGDSAPWLAERVPASVLAYVELHGLYRSAAAKGAAGAEGPAGA